MPDQPDIPDPTQPDPGYDSTDFMTSSASAWRACGGQTVIDNQGDGNSGT
jgi:hypothetical protein